MVLYKVHVFYPNRKFKMATAAGLGLTLDPMGKRLKKASSLKLFNQWKQNLLPILFWMVIYKVCVFYANWKIKMATTAGLCLTYGKKFKRLLL